LALPNRKSFVLVGVGFEGGFKKQVAWHSSHGGQHARIADTTLLTQQCHQRTALAAVAIGIAVGRNRRSDKRKG
jgi:hypothetical protein